MKKNIAFFNWRTMLQNPTIDSLGEDFALYDTAIASPLDYPFKLDIMVIIICIKGSMSGTVNLKSISIRAGGMVIMLPGQILEHEYSSDDFYGLSIMMSKRFVDSLEIRSRLDLLFSVKANPSIALTEEGLEAVKNYYYTVKKVVRTDSNPYRAEMVKHQTISFFYGLTYLFRQLYGRDIKSEQSILLENFLKEVQTHYKKQRNVKFYADKLCITPKYLGMLIRRHSYKSANSWIDDFVMLEAKALLKSTNMTIQQISDELNFSEQSFFLQILQTA